MAHDAPSPPRRPRRPAGESAGEAPPAARRLSPRRALHTRWARASRALSIFASPRSEPRTGDGDILSEREIEAAELARGLGIRAAYRPSGWDTLEPVPGRYDVSRFADGIRHLAERGFAVMVTLQVIDTLRRRVPADLADVPFDAPEMQERFRALFDALLPGLTSSVRFLSIGNEVDPYLHHNGGWVAYKTFLDRATAHVHARAPWIRVGATCTFIGAVSASVLGVAFLNQATDVYAITYYPFAAPFDGSYSLSGPEAPRADFPRLLALAGSKPVVLQEVGYPASDLFGSEERQADFVHHVFAAWQATGRRIPFLSFFQLHDFPVEVCDVAGEYYSETNADVIREFVSTLGLRRRDGTPRLAWQALAEHARRFRP